MQKKAYIIGAVIIVLAMFMAMRSFKSTLTAYVSVSEATTSKTGVQVAGIVVKDSARYNLKTNNLIFTLREDGGDEMPVEYNGPSPGNLNDATKVVAIGKYEPDKQVFMAVELLVKCPTKYEQRVKGE
ncbi:MAG: cytochrome c maturation protein CcmE [Thermodesulfobacteriota bacterium]|nr:cytochrome c maturation protein CcmE [Thermodesulfobacteriota bacterium]